VLMRSRSKGAGRPNGPINRGRRPVVSKRKDLRDPGPRLAILHPKSRIYLIVCETTGRVKIGWTINTVARLRTLQAASPTRLRLVGDVPGNRQREQELHRMLDAFRLHGEWFEYGREVRDVLCRELNPAFMLPDPP
jgi:hypothetical protein